MSVAISKLVPMLLAMFLIFCLFGIQIDSDTIWSLGDIEVSCMLWVNTFATLLLTPQIIHIIKDYEKPKNLVLNPLFDPATVGIKDEAGVGDTYAAKKKACGDYKNPEPGYKNASHNKDRTGFPILSFVYKATRY